MRGIKTHNALQSRVLDPLSPKGKKCCKYNTLYTSKPAHISTNSSETLSNLCGRQRDKMHK